MDMTETLQKNHKEEWWAVYVLGSTNPDKPIALFEYGDMAYDFAKANYENRNKIEKVKMTQPSDTFQMKFTIRDAAFWISALCLSLAFWSAGTRYGFDVVLPILIGLTLNLLAVLFFYVLIKADRG